MRDYYFINRKLSQDQILFNRGQNCSLTLSVSSKENCRYSFIGKHMILQNILIKTAQENTYKIQSFSSLFLMGWSGRK